jgi:sugar-specific transcriptional regulator TrmB
LSKETIEEILRNFGLTQTEQDIYLFLARHDALKGTQIARQLKKDKAQVYHILKRLQTKNLVEVTLESPTRFVAVPFEEVVDSEIKAKRDEAAHIEGLREELFDYWRKISHEQPELQIERFNVIGEENRIYNKIVEMASKAKFSFSASSSFKVMLRGERYGLVDAVYGPIENSHVQYRFLTELDGQEADFMKAISGKLKAKFLFRGHSQSGLHLQPHMIIQDKEEALIFITPNSEVSVEQKDVCLWTNCSAIVQTFNVVFEALWLTGVIL